MRDSEVVASIVAGDPNGLAVAYDKYADDLYSYCRSLLRDPNDAADAVQDTFVIAASKLAGLRDPERLRAWLFAVARNECLHRLKSRHAAAPLHEVPEPADDGVDVGRAAERAETIALVRAAADGLNDGDRDLINQLWHGLDVPEVAAILGVSRNHAYALFSRARDQLEASVGVLLVGRAGRRDCPTLDRLLGDWDGRLTALLRKRMVRHIDRCPVCSDRRRRELAPALLYGLTPGALLAMAGLRKIAALASGQPGAPLSWVRDALPRPAAGPAAPTATYGEVTGRSMHSFGISGFPRPPHHRFLGYAQRPHLPLAAVGAAAIAAGAVVVAVVVVPHPQPTRGHPGGGLTLGGPVPGGAPVVPGGATGSDSPSAPDAAPAGAPVGGTASGPTGRRATRGGDAPAPGSAGSSAPAGSTASGGPTALSASRSAPSAGPVGPTGPADGPASGVPVTATAPPSSAPLSAGTLTVTPATVLLSPLLGGTLTLTASGGPVSWSISEPASLLGKLIVVPVSGALSAGGSATVTITVAGLVSLDTQLTVRPGGHQVTVLLGLG